jgi:hypothetical protein
LTGLWQVSGKNQTTFLEMVRLDIRYAETVSPWLDAWIILRTVPSLLHQIHGTARSKYVTPPSPHTNPPLGDGGTEHWGDPMPGV